MQSSIEAERALKQAAIFKDIRSATIKAQEDATKAQQEGTDAYMAYLRGEELQKKQTTAGIIQNILRNETEMTDELYAEMAEKLGVDEAFIRAEYTNQETTMAESVAAAAAAEAKSASALAYQEAQTYDLMNKGNLQTQSEMADLEKERLSQSGKTELELLGQEGDLSLEEIRQAGDLAKIQAQNTPTQLDIIEQQVKIDSMIKEMEQIGQEKALSPLDRQKKELEIAKLQQDLNVKIAKDEKEQIAAGKDVEVLDDKLKLIDEIIGHDGLNNVVGPNVLARLGFDPISGNAQAAIGKIRQLVDKEVLDTLIELKARGGTLGAISEKELQILGNAATAINGFANEKGTRWKVTETEFKAELKKIRDSAQRLRDAAQADREEAGGFTNEQIIEGDAEMDDLFN